MAVNSVLLLLDTMTYLNSVIQSTHEYFLIHEMNNTVYKHESQGDTPNIGASRVSADLHFTTVHHFARHGLCNHYNGQRRFYMVMKSKVCGLKPAFIANYVLTLCKERKPTLDDWVSELFDLDGDGVLSHREKNQYR
ncbi:hypothetical protein ACF0H5_023748 [Mactra antiquata]